MDDNLILSKEEPLVTEVLKCLEMETRWNFVKMRKEIGKYKLN